ncbi:ABC transporter substrate-binding protein [Pseudonocardia kunmingensis]|uniref:Peptide/nickel transport system substrate-binding protein n=1 Tax=Pseudonocardia kunmingensis TaxID=630975 RepID=A0A543DRV5_9PSEU|nr:ABC transporter substrate-binding protein [Pseudonocardia kunmingensis]TQM12029.1 peptide/nickel transport system substrate-binding protein [Pseudonocardia kunmingensis]
MRRAPTLSLAACLGALALLATACGGAGDGSADRPVDGATFTYVISADPGNLDPHQTVLSVTNNFNTLTYDTLVAHDADNRPVPGIAEAWEADATSATFTLRPDVVCDDGTPMTASVVQANLDYLKDPANASPLIGTTFPNRDFTTTADDTARTVTVTMAQPYGFLLESVASVPIVCPAGMSDRDVLARGSAGTGPFTLTEAVAGDHYTLVRREGYTWGPGGASTDAAGFPDRVVVRVVDNEATAANLLLAGDVNAAAITGVDQERLRVRGMFESATDRITGQLWFNHKQGHPGSDPAVRRALTLALDLHELRMVMTSGLGSAPTAMAVLEPRGCTGDTVAGTLPAQDVAAARRALDEAGWTLGADGTRSRNGTPLTLRLLYKSGLDDLSAGMELLARRWQENLGVVVESRAMTDTGIIEATFGGDAWDVANLPLNAYLPVTISPFATGATPPDGSNYTAIDNPAYTELAARAQVTAGEAGCELWNRAESALFTAFDVVPVAQAPTPVFGSGARFDSRGGAVIPTSIMMVAAGED